MLPDTAEKIGDNQGPLDMPLNTPFTISMYQRCCNDRPRQGRCVNWFTADTVVIRVMNSQTYQGKVVQHSGWVKEQLYCESCVGDKEKHE